MDDYIPVRVSTEDKQRFKEKCAECGIDSSSAFIREMIQAFNEDRLKIRRPDIPANQRKIYHDN